jgi:hypothetical protein
LILPREDGATLEYRWDWKCGAPVRSWRPKRIRLGLGEWAQVTYNGRFTDWDDGNWWYERHVVNVGLFDAMTGEEFLSRELAAGHRDMALLF